MAQFCVPIESAPYRLSRTELARLAAGEYVRNFWWLVATVPTFGVLAIAFGSGVLQGIGMFALLWPFSIPARSVLSTRKASRLFCKGCRMVAGEDRVEFLGDSPGESGKPLRMVLSREEIRKVALRGEYLIFQSLRFGFAPVPISSLAGSSEVEALRSRFRQAS